MQGGIAAGAVILLTVFLTSLKPAAPTVDRATLWVDSVRRGEMVREVRGPGTLVPEHIRFITALAAGRVDRVLAQPGQHVKPETVLLDLSNPDVQIQALQAEQQLAAARAELVRAHQPRESAPDADRCRRDHAHGVLQGEAGGRSRGVARRARRHVA